MRINRRAWLALLTAGGVVAGVGGVATQWPRLRTWIAPLSGSEALTLSRLCDLLVPADETPGALDLGVDQALLHKAAGDRPLARSLSRTCRWFDDESIAAHGVPFLELAEARQLALMERMAGLDPQSWHGGMFWTLRGAVMELHYSQPQSWPGVRFEGPPQPEGHMDYSQAPKARA